MARQREYEQLAKLKKQKKELEEKIKEKEKQLLDNIPALKVETQYGVLSLQERPNHKIPSNVALINFSTINEKDFKKYAKFPITELKKLIGEKGFKELIEQEIVEVKSTSIYYTLTCKKED